MQRIRDAGAEIAYTEGVFPPSVSFAAGWTMVLSYAIVCPWEAVATGNLLARVFPALNSYQLYAIAGRPIYAPRLAVGLALTALIAFVNYRGIKPSGVFQDVMTFGLLATFAIFTVLGFARGAAAEHAAAVLAAGHGRRVAVDLPGAADRAVLHDRVRVGGEGIRGGASAGFDPRNFTKAIYAALVAGLLFYVIIIAVVTYVYPWQEIVSGHVRTEVAFERTFGSHAIAQLILFGAFLSLLKIFNGNFVAATRMLYAIGRRNLVHPSLGRVHATARHAGGGDRADGAAHRGRGDVRRRDPRADYRGRLARGRRRLAVGVRRLSRAPRAGATGIAQRIGRRWRGSACAVSAAIVLMKVVPGVPGSFTRAEWIAFAAWSAFGLRLLARAPRRSRRRHSRRRLKRLRDELVLRQAAENLDRRRSRPSSARR